MIKIYSTFSKDTILDNGRKLTKGGGPAFFIKKLFKKYKIKHKLYSNGIIEVKIKVINNNESGKIISKIKKNNKIQNIKNNDLIVISTIGREWILDNEAIPPQAKIFLDIQGYIRIKEKNDEFFKNNFWNKIYCIKGIEKEINKLPKNIIKNQKKKCLIITKGEKGSIMYFKNKKYIFRAKKMKLKNTIGAGDTFFAALVANFIKTKNLIQSGKFAVEEVEKFLLTKIKNYE